MDEETHQQIRDMPPLRVDAHAYLRQVVREERLIALRFLADKGNDVRQELGLPLRYTMVSD